MTDAARLWNTASILSLPFSWTRMYSLIFNAAARARSHLSGTLITHPTHTSSNSTTAQERTTTAPAESANAATPAVTPARAFQKDRYASVSMHPLAQRCVLLLLVLVHNHRAADADVNPFRAAFCTLADQAPEPQGASKDDATVDDEDALSNVKRVQLPFAELVASVCKEVPLESSSLLLYTLLQSNPELMYCTLERIGPENMMETVLHGLYHPVGCNGTKHLYTLVITLLMCTQDEAFVANSFRSLKLPTVSWYKERLLKNISIGSLSILCLLRTLVFALINIRDEYLLANVLAALSNLSSQIEHIHPYAAQRCVSLPRYLVSSANCCRLSHLLPSFRCRFAEWSWSASSWHGGSSPCRIQRFAVRPSPRLSGRRNQMRLPRCERRLRAARPWTMCNRAPKLFRPCSCS